MNTARARSAALALLFSLCLTLLAPGLARATQEEYDRGYRHGYDACPDTQVRPNPGNLPSDYFAGWVAGCIDAMQNKRTPEQPLPGQGGTMNGSGFTFPGMVATGYLSGNIFFRSNRWTRGYWVADTSVSGIDLNTTTPFQGTGGMTLVQTYHFTVMGQALEIPVFTYTTAGGAQAFFSSGQLGSVSPDGRKAFIGLAEGQTQRYYIVDLPQGGGCTQAAPCTNVTMREVPGVTLQPTGIRVSWSPDSQRIAFTEIEPYWERPGWIADVSGDPVQVENLYNRFTDKCFFGTYNGGRNEVWDWCRHSDLRFSPDGKRLLVVGPTEKLVIYEFPFTREWRMNATTLLTVPKRQRIENAAWSPDGKWIAYVRRLCGADSQDTEGHPEPCGWFYGQPTGYIGVINVETKQEYQITPVTQMPAGAVADLVWTDAAFTPPRAAPATDPVPAPFAVNFTVKTEGGETFLEVQSFAPGTATLSFRLRSSTGVPYTVEGTTAKTGEVVRVKLPDLAADTYQVDGFARLDDGRVLTQISAAALTLQKGGGGSAKDLEGPPQADGSTPIDPITGRPIDPILSQEPGLWVSKPIDPVTGIQIGADGPVAPVQEVMAPGVDPVTGNPVAAVISRPVDPVSGKPIDLITGQPIPVQTAEGIQLWGGATVLTPTGAAAGLDLYLAQAIPGFNTALIETHLSKVPEVFRSAEVKVYQSKEIPVFTADEVQAVGSTEIEQFEGTDLGGQTGGSGSGQPPATDWGLQAVSVGGKAQLTWTAQPEAAKGYYLYRAERSGEHTRTPTSDFPVTATTYTDPNSYPGKTYYYVVRPVLASGAEGAASPEVSVTIPEEGSAARSIVIRLELDKTTGTVNGAPATLDVPPQLMNERTMVPFRFLGTALGADLVWDALEQKVTYRLDGVEIVLWVGKTTALVQGVEKQLDVAPTTVEGRLLIPLRFVSENLGAAITFDGRARSIEITYPR